MDFLDVLRFVVPILAFALAVTALLYYLPWPPKTLLNRERQQAKILDIIQVSHDTKRFRISTGEKGTILGLPVGKHIVVSAPNPSTCLTSGNWNGAPDPDGGSKEVDRKYTPITGDDTVGYFDLIVKSYTLGKVKMADGKAITWTDGGKVSSYLDSKVPGDYIDINGPMGNIEYLGCGTFKLPDRTIEVKHVGMLAGGTGITPMLQVLRAAIRYLGDHCRFTLIYANKTEDDILARDVLEALVVEGKGQLNIIYTLNFPPSKWKHETGFIDAGMIKRNIPAPRPRSTDPLILICGPPPMVAACRNNAVEVLGYPKASLVEF